MDGLDVQDLQLAIESEQWKSDAYFLDWLTDQIWQLIEKGQQIPAGTTEFNRLFWKDFDSKKPDFSDLDFCTIQDATESNEWRTNPDCFVKIFNSFWNLIEAGEPCPPGTPEFNRILFSPFTTPNDQVSELDLALIQAGIDSKRWETDPDYFVTIFQNRCGD